MNNNKLNKVLVGIIIALLVILIAGTISGFILKSQNTPENLIAEGKAENLLPPKQTAETAYYELGTMRIIPEEDVANEEMASVMVISPWISYPTGDDIFYEEIARKEGVIKSIFRSYFSQRTRNQILAESEEKITKALLKQINEKMSLGKIENIYFTDYIFLE